METNFPLVRLDLELAEQPTNFLPAPSRRAGRARHARSFQRGVRTAPLTLLRPCRCWYQVHVAPGRSGVPQVFPPRCRGARPGPARTSRNPKRLRPSGDLPPALVPPEPEALAEEGFRFDQEFRPTAPAGAPVTVRRRRTIGTRPLSATAAHPCRRRSCRRAVASPSGRSAGSAHAAGGCGSAGRRCCRGQSLAEDRSRLGHAVDRR